MRGQMFIVTMVFLTGLVVFVSQLLLSYTVVDVSDVPDRTGTYVVKSYIDIINDTIQSSRNCTDANDSIRELHGFLNRLVTEGYFSSIKYGTNTLPDLTNEDCQRFNDPAGTPSLMKVSMNVIAGVTEADGTYDFKRLFIAFPPEPTCYTDGRSIRMLELWCKSDVPIEETCKKMWGVRVADCATCIDSDGPNKDERGSVTEYGACASGQTSCPLIQQHADSCKSSTVVYEQICDGLYWSPTPLELTCGTGKSCADGQCV